MFESKVFDKITGDLIFILDSDDYLFSKFFKSNNK